MSKFRLSVLLLLTISAALMHLPQAFAQGPGAPTDLSIERLGDAGIRLSWTSPPGTGNRFLIERGGPGYTFFTQIAGPISETTYVVDSKTSGLALNERYSFRVRAIDAASNKGPYSPAVSPPAAMKSLPLVSTTEVLSLIRTLYDQTPTCPALLRADASAINCRLTLLSAQSQSVSFMFKETTGRTVSFESAEGTFSWSCPNCEFAVGATGIGPATGGGPALTFQLSADGSQLLLTCRATNCQVLNASIMDITNGVVSASGGLAQRTLSTDESIRVSSSQRALLTISR